MVPLKVLLLAANPEAKNLRLSAEQNEIRERVEQAERRRQKTSPDEPATPIEFISVGAARLRDLFTELQSHAPQVLHFSGHGAASGELIFEDSTGRRAPVAPEIFGNVLGEFHSSLRLVFLNACYSQAQAAGIVANISCFIGMTQAIEDPAALAFAATFYHLVALGSSVGRAFRCAREDMVVLGLSGDTRAIPCLITGAGVDADQVFLAPAESPAQRGQRGAADPTRPVDAPSTSQVRAALNHRLPNDAALNGFLSTQYPHIAKQTGDNMQRTTKLNILLTYETNLAGLYRSLLEFCAEHAGELL